MSSQDDLIARAQLLYVAYYGRPADPEGLQFWADMFGDSDNVDDAVAAFGASPEYLAISEAAGGDNEALINNLYQNMFNRDADEEGLAFYLGQLTAGTATLATIALDIANGATGDDVTILNNKVQVANAYTQAVEDGNRQYNADDIPAARNVLSAVGLEASTVTTGETAARNAVNILPEIIAGGEFTVDEDEQTADYSAATSAVTVTLNGDNDEADFVITGSAFDDTFILEEFQSARINGHGGSDTIDFSDLDGPVRISLLSGAFSVEHDNQPFGGSVSNVENVIGTEGDDMITGNGADNSFWGGEGNDDIRGGLGDDTFYFADQTELGDGSVNGQFGSDTLRFTGNDVDLSDVDTSQVVNIENIVIGNSDNRSTATLTIDPTKRFLGANVITGSAATDTIRLSEEGDMDLTQIEDLELRSIEVIQMAAGSARNELRISSTDSVAGIRLVAGDTSDVIVLDGPGAYDLSQTNFSGFDGVEVDAPNNGAGVTVTVSQRNLDALGMNEGITGLGSMGVLSFAGDVDLTSYSEEAWYDALSNIAFGRATQVLLGGLHKSGVSITGGAGGTDTLIVEAGGTPGSALNVDLSGVAFKDVERLVFDTALRRSDDFNLTIGKDFKDIERVRGHNISTLTLQYSTGGEGVETVDLRGIDFGLSSDANLNTGDGGSMFAVVDQATLDSFDTLGGSGLTVHLVSAGALDLSEAAGVKIAAGSSLHVEATAGNVDDVVRGTSRDSDGEFLDHATYNLGGGNNQFRGSGLVVDMTARNDDEEDGAAFVQALIGRPGAASGRLTTGDENDTVTGYLMGLGNLGKGDDTFIGHANADVLTDTGPERVAVEEGFDFAGLDLGDGNDSYTELGLAWALGAQGRENRADSLTGEMADAADLAARKLLAQGAVDGGKGDDSLTALIDGTELTGGEGDDTFTVSARSFSLSKSQYDADEDGKLDNGGVKIMDMNNGDDVVQIDVLAEFTTGTGLTENGMATMGELKIATPLADALTDDGGLRVMTRNGDVFTRAAGDAIGTTDAIGAASAFGGDAGLDAHLDTIGAPDEGTYVVFATAPMGADDDGDGVGDDAKLCAFVVKDGKLITVGGDEANKDDKVVYTIAVFADAAGELFAGDIIIV